MRKLNFDPTLLIDCRKSPPTHSLLNLHRLRLHQHTHIGRAYRRKMQPGVTNSESKKNLQGYDEPTRAGFAGGVRMEFD